MFQNGKEISISIYESTDQYSAFVSVTKIVDVSIAYFGYAGSQASTTDIKSLTLQVLQNQQMHHSQ